jgi:hypothetical protein
VAAIAHELLKLAGNKSHDFGLVQAQAARKAPLRQLPDSREDELVLSCQSWTVV